MSLVPNEKNSASFAISCAVIAARGSSIMVPIMKLRSMPTSLLDLLDRLERLGPDDRELLHVTDERHHDLRVRVETAFAELGGRFGDGADLQQEQPGNSQAQPHTTHAEHRVLLMVALDFLEQLGGALVRARRPPRQPRP